NFRERQRGKRLPSLALRAPKARAAPSRYFSSQARPKRANVIRSYGERSPRSYRQPTVRSGSTVSAEYAAGPACSTFATGQVAPSASLRRTVIFSRFVLAGLANSSRFLP